MSTLATGCGGKCNTKCDKLVILRGRRLRAAYRPACVCPKPVTRHPKRHLPTCPGKLPVLDVRRCTVGYSLSATPQLYRGIAVHESVQSLCGRLAQQAASARQFLRNLTEYGHSAPIGFRAHCALALAKALRIALYETERSFSPSKIRSPAGGKPGDSDKDFVLVAEYTFSNRRRADLMLLYTGADLPYHLAIVIEMKTRIGTMLSKTPYSWKKQMKDYLFRLKEDWRRRRDHRNNRYPRCYAVGIFLIIEPHRTTPFFYNKIGTGPFRYDPRIARYRR